MQCCYVRNMKQIRQQPKSPNVFLLSNANFIESTIWTRNSQRFKTTLAGRFNLFEDRLLDTTKEHLGQSGSNMALMESRMEKLLSFVEGAREKPSPRARTDDEMQDSVLDELAITAIADDTNTLSHSESTACEGNDSRVSEESRSSSSSSGVASMDAESVCRIQSPEHKRQRSSQKKKLSDSIRRHLDNQHFSSESNSVANMSNDTNT